MSNGGMKRALSPTLLVIFTACLWPLDGSAVSLPEGSFLAPSRVDVDKPHTIEGETWTLDADYDKTCVHAVIANMLGGAGLLANPYGYYLQLVEAHQNVFMEFAQAVTIMNAYLEEHELRWVAREVDYRDPNHLCEELKRGQQVAVGLVAFTGPPPIRHAVSMVGWDADFDELFVLDPDHDEWDPLNNRWVDEESYTLVENVDYGWGLDSYRIPHPFWVRGAMTLCPVPDGGVTVLLFGLALAPLRAMQKRRSTPERVRP